MSARAAWRLESMGFIEVYRYTPGKMDWFAAGLPREGEKAGSPRVMDMAIKEVPVCDIGDTIGEAKAQASERGLGLCVVTNRQGIVLGLLWGDMLERPPATPVEEVMDPGPATVRPNTHPDDAKKRMHDIDAVLVTTPSGQLIGLYHSQEGEHSHSHDRYHNNREE